MEMLLKKIKVMAKAKIATGEEPPWAWYQYMKLIDAADAILDSIGHTSPTGSSQELAQHQGKPLRLVARNDRQNNAQDPADHNSWPPPPM